MERHASAVNNFGFRITQTIAVKMLSIANTWWANRPQVEGAAGRSKRDHRIDWLRGFALVSIFINHMPGNRLENWTTRNFGFSDAAEMFVLLAGIAAAFAFFPRFQKGDYAGVSMKSVRRAGVLYGAHLASTLAAVCVFAAAAWLLQNSEVFELIGVGPVFTDPIGVIFGILSGGFQLGYFNILPLYVFLILLVPGLMWLAMKDLRLMLAVSGGVYLAAHLLPIQMPNFPTDGGWFFNPFAWQLIFTIGIALGVLKLRGKAIGWHPVAGALAALYVLFAAVWMARDMGGRVSFDLLPMWMDTLHKSMLPASRLLHILALSYLLVHSPLWTWMARISPQNFLTVMGRNSLPVFVLGSLLSMVGYITLVHTGSLLWLELMLTAAGILAMTAMAVLIERGVVARWRSVALASARSLAGVKLEDEHSSPITRR